MPQWRKLHTKIVESLDFQDMPDDFVRLVWVLLPLGLDREGRTLNSAALVKAHIMPLRDDVTTGDIERALSWFVERGMVKRYTVNGRQYVYIPTFHDYQGNTTKEAKSDYPAPPELVQSKSSNTPELVQSKSSTDVDVDVDVDVDSDADVDVDTEVDSDADVDVDSDTDVEESDPFPSSDFSKRAMTAYQNTIGLVSGAQQAGDIDNMLTELEQKGLRGWWFAAIQIAGDQNKRSWAYVRGVLNNCLREGKAPVVRTAAQTTGPPKKRVVKVRGDDGVVREVEAIA